MACPGCGYNLRGLTSDRCPECNQRLVVGIALAEPKQRAFIAGLLGISLPLGFCVMLLIWVVYMILDRGGPGGPAFREIVPILLGAVIGGSLLGGWLMFRRAILRCSLTIRWTLAVVVTVIATLGPLWFMATVR